MNRQLDNRTMQYNSYQVDNYAGDKTSGKYLCIQALAESLNLPAVATVNELVFAAFDAGERFGLNMEKVDRVLGVPSVEVMETNHSQMAQAYAALPMEVMQKPAFHPRENASGQVIKS